MGLEVLEPSWVPPLLLHRQEMLERLKVLLREGVRVAVRGVSGVGKTTVVKIALNDLGLAYTWVDCSLSRTYASLSRRLRNRRGVVVLDDYTLVRRDRRVHNLVAKLDRAIAIIHPWTIFPELEGYTILEMPPYNSQELYDILADRVLHGNLNVDEESLAYISETIGHPRGPGSARIALQLLKLSLELGEGKTNIEITKDVVRRYYL